MHTDRADIEKDGHLVNNGEVDDRLLNARRIIFIGTARDKGTVKIDLTSRTVQTYYSSPNITEALISFKEQVLQEARSRWITAVGAWGIFFIPLLALGADLLVDALANPRIRYDWWGMPQGQSFYPGPDQIASNIAALIGSAAIITTLAAIAIAIIVARAGPLRTWPDAFTADAFQQVAYRLRSAILGNAAIIIVGIFCALLGAIVTALLTR